MAMCEGLYPGDFDVDAAAVLPDALAAVAVQAGANPNFEAEFDEWLDHLLTDDDDLTLLLAIEQSCHLGVLLPWDMRGVRLATLPPATLASLHRWLEACPRHVLVYMANYVYWLLRSERARRRGSPEWSPSLPNPPVLAWMQEPPAFKPMRSWPSRWP